MILQLKDRASQLRQVIAPRPYQLFSREFHVTNQTPTTEVISNTPTLKRERGRGRERGEGERGEKEGEKRERKGEGERERGRERGGRKK